MIVRRPSASKLGHALRAPAALWLDQRPDTSDKSKAERGTRIHAGLERYLLSGRRTEARFCVKEDEDTILRDAIDGLPEREILEPLAGWPMLEVECWWNPLSLVAQLGRRDGTPPPGFYRGRADFIGRWDGRLTVLDFKTGDPRWQTAPEISAQLYFFSRFLSIHPDTAEEFAKTGAVHMIYLTQRSNTEDHAERFLTSVADVNLCEQFGNQVQDLEMLLGAVETGKCTPPPHDAAACGKFCRCIIPT